MSKRQQIVSCDEQKYLAEWRKQTIICIECNEPVTGVPYSFGGALACEQCIRKYCRTNGRNDTAELELRERALEAKSLIRNSKRSMRVR
jgi:hypothetical protein